MTAGLARVGACLPYLLSGRHVLVTGAASGIGRAVTAGCRAVGATVSGVDVRPAPGLIFCDVSSEPEVEAAFAEAGARAPVTDVVHAAGVFHLSEVRHEELSDWRRILDVNLTGGFLVGRAAARRLIDGGSITFIASMAGRRGEARRAAYSASKFGLLGLMESLARELAPDGIRVNAVCPGSVETSMGERAVAGEAELLGLGADEMRARFEARIPLGRLADPEEIANVCVFLASPMASYVAGATIVVNGAG